jgi:hypothetical protein
MGGTADKSTPLRMPWCEALKRAGSFDALRPYLHMGRIPAHHGGLYTSDGKVHSGPGILRPEKWAVVDKDRAGRVIFFTEDLVFGRIVQEEVFAYAVSIELDSVAFDTFFPVATVSTIVDKAGLEPAPPTEPPRVEPEPLPPLEPEPAPPTEPPRVEPEPLPPPEPELVKAEHTRWQRDRTIEAIRSLYPPDGIRPKGVSIAALTKRINKLLEFKGGDVSEDTVRLADIEIKAAKARKK